MTDHFLHKLLNNDMISYGPGLETGVETNGISFLARNRVRIWRTGWHNVPHQEMPRVPLPSPRETVMMPFLREEDR